MIIQDVSDVDFIFDEYPAEVEVDGDVELFIHDSEKLEYNPIEKFFHDHRDYAVTDMRICYTDVLKLKLTIRKKQYETFFIR